jgi:DNA polymerase III epsilon subunit family exonuclease
MSEQSLPRQQWYEYGPFSIFDVETTGFSPTQDRIIEIAATRIELNGTISKFHALINPECPVPPKVTALTRIDDAMLADAPSFTNVAYKFMDFIRDTTLVAHNARFDLGFLQESLARNGLELWRGKTIDSIRLIRQAFAGLPAYNLQSLRQSFKLEHHGELNAHRAAADVELTMKLFIIAFEAILQNTRK